MAQFTIPLRPEPPFDFALTAGYHTYFRGTYGSDSVEDGVYCRLLDVNGKLILTSTCSVGSVDAPELMVSAHGEGLTETDAQQAAQQVAWLLGAAQDLKPFYALARLDPVLSPIVERFYGLHLPHTASVFEALILAILGQQIATSVARIIRGLLIETYGPLQEFGGVTYHAFPRPESLAAASLEELRKLKLSQRKAEYIQGIARAALDPAGPLAGLDALPDVEVIHRVMGLRGVGHWTAQWVLLRALGRPDAFPLGDLALRRAVARLYFEAVDINDAALADFSLRWSPWRAAATVYLFTALRHGMA